MLTAAAEQRLGKLVDVAVLFELRHLASPSGHLRLRRPLRVLLARTDDALYLLEYRYRVLACRVGGVICDLPRRGLVAQCKRQPWAWPMTWRAEFSWPDAATFMAGALMASDEADRLVGLPGCEATCQARRSQSS